MPGPSHFILLAKAVLYLFTDPGERRTLRKFEDVLAAVEVAS